MSWALDMTTICLPTPSSFPVTWARFWGNQQGVCYIQIGPIMPAALGPEWWDIGTKWEPLQDQKKFGGSPVLCIIPATSLSTLCVKAAVVRAWEPQLIHIIMWSACYHPCLPLCLLLSSGHISLIRACSELFMYPHQLCICVCVYSFMYMCMCC